MRGVGKMGILEVIAFGKRVTVNKTETRILRNGEKKKVSVAKNYWIENGAAKEEMIYFAGKEKKRVYGRAVSVRSLYPMIKHVYDQNGVLIARRNHPNDHLRCTAKGMGRKLAETNERITKAEKEKLQRA